MQCKIITSCGVREMLPQSKKITLCIISGSSLGKGCCFPLYLGFILGTEECEKTITFRP